MTNHEKGEEMSVDPRVTARHVAKEQVEVAFRQYSVLCDHPRSAGGDDTGPTPGEFVLAGLAASIAQHLGRYAAKLAIRLDAVEVHVDFEVDREGSTGPLDFLSRLSAIRADVELAGDLTDHQFEQLSVVAENCSIANTLRRAVVPEIEISLAHSTR